MISMRYVNSRIFDESRVSFASEIHSDDGFFWKLLNGMFWKMAETMKAKLLSGP